MNDFLIWVRSILYFLIGIEFLILAFSYYWGYMKKKHTNIIGIFTKLFFFLGVYFMFLVLLSYTAYLQPKVRDLMLPSSKFFLIPIFYYLNRFLWESFSLQKDEKKKIVQTMYKQNRKLAKKINRYQIFGHPTGGVKKHGK
jgi:hypothetical protein